MALKPTNQPKSLVAEIAELEKRIEAMGFEDDLGLSDLDMGMESIEEVGEVAPVDFDDEEFMNMDDEMTEFCGRMGSESKPGIEDEITQDYLSEVVNLVDGDGSVTEDSMLDAARSASEEEIEKLASATKRLDRVATYLEQQGRKKLAFRIDQISDAIEARINGGKQ